MANVFSSDEMLAAARSTLCAGRSSEVVTARVEQRCFRLLSVGGRPLPALPFFDFLEPIPDSSGPAIRMAYLPRVSLESVPAADWPRAGRAETVASPWVRWGSFATWDAFLTGVEGRHCRPFGSARKRRKLTRERGELRFEPESRERNLLRRCMAWKSEQYRRTGAIDAFASDRIVAFFDRLFDERLLVVSTLFAGEEPVAIHLGCRFEGRFYYWVPAYDDSAASHSPGALLLEALLEESHGRGDREFDFLIGDEDYKFHYATDVRLVGELGRPPLATRLWRPLRGAVLPQARRLGPAYRVLKSLKRRALQLRLR